VARGDAMWNLLHKTHCRTVFVGDESNQPATSAMTEVLTDKSRVNVETVKSIRCKSDWLSDRELQRLDEN